MYLPGLCFIVLLLNCDGMLLLSTFYSHIDNKTKCHTYTSMVSTRTFINQYLNNAIRTVKKDYLPSVNV